MRRAERELQSVSACDQDDNSGHGWFLAQDALAGALACFLSITLPESCMLQHRYVRWVLPRRRLAGASSVNTVTYGQLTTTTAKLRVRDSAAPRARVNDETRKSILTTACQ